MFWACVLYHDSIKREENDIKKHVTLQTREKLMFWWQEFVKSVLLGQHLVLSKFTSIGARIYTIVCGVSAGGMNKILKYVVTNRPMLSYLCIINSYSKKLYFN